MLRIKMLRIKMLKIKKFNRMEHLLNNYNNIKNDYYKESDYYKENNIRINNETVSLKRCPICKGAGWILSRNKQIGLIFSYDICKKCNGVGYIY
jgi:DnaJ-class molecular chaperone